MLNLKIKKKIKPYEQALESISPLARKHEKKRWNKSAVELMFMVSLGVIFIAIFAYLPMFGLILAFKSGDGYLNIMDAIFNSAWCGFDNFIAFFNDPDFGNVMLNTLGLNILQLCINFPFPIMFAILLSELPWKKIKKSIQVVTYFPYFLSWITYGAIILALINSDGILNVIERVKLFENKGYDSNNLSNMNTDIDNLLDSSNSYCYAPLQIRDDLGLIYDDLYLSRVINRGVPVAIFYDKNTSDYPPQLIFSEDNLIFGCL